MLGNWRINNGILRAGTLRIAKMDYDTNPSDEFKKDIEQFIVTALNKCADDDLYQE